MDDRCDKFCEDATKAQAPGKEITTLRRFLQRNQEQRLTDKAQDKLLEAIRVHVTRAKEDGSEPAIGAASELAKDALSMPFNIFGTRHKKPLLKWHNELAGLVPGSDADGPAQQPPKAKVLQVLDMDADGYLTLMCPDTGDTVSSVRVERKGAHYKAIKRALEDKEVAVEVLDDEVLGVSVEE